MRNRSVFFDDWRECLRSHYFHVVRIDDLVTEPTLRAVLLAAGIPLDEINQWRDEATELREAGDGN